MPSLQVSRFLQCQMLYFIVALSCEIGRIVRNRAFRHSRPCIKLQTECQTLSQEKRLQGALSMTRHQVLGLLCQMIYIFVALPCEIGRIVRNRAFRHSRPCIKLQTECQTLSQEKRLQGALSMTRHQVLGLLCQMIYIFVALPCEIGRIVRNRAFWHSQASRSHSS